MVALPQALSTNCSFIKTHPLVAVFVGGTSGIGEYSINELCRLHPSADPSLRIYIVGRNATAAERTIKTNHAVAPDAQVEFVKAGDLSLMKNVDTACEEILSREKDHGNGARIDLLVMTQGTLNFEGRKETSEGLGMVMSLLYYSRIRFATKLMPLLQCSTLPTGSRVISVFAAGLEGMGTLYPSDLSLREPNHYSHANMRTTVIHMTTMAFEHLARENQGKVAFVHVFPSLVITPAFEAGNLPWWFRAAWRIARPVLQWTYAVTPERIGQTVLYLLCDDGFGAKGKGQGDRVVGTNGEKGAGAYAVGHDAESSGVEKYYVELRKQAFEEKVWEHTMEAMKVIAEGEIFRA